MKKFFVGHREIIMYFSVGILISAATMLTFFTILWGGQAIVDITDHAGTEYRVVYSTAKLMSWLISVVVAFLTNKRWVFHSKAHNRREAARQLTSFIAGRAVTLVFDYVSNYALIALFLFAFEMDETRIVEVVAWVLTQTAVVTLNYFYSKLFVFRARTQNSQGKTQSNAQSAELNERNRAS